jgi:hypothetical protein
MHVDEVMGAVEPSVIEDHNYVGRCLAIPQQLRYDTYIFRSQLPDFSDLEPKCFGQDNIELPPTTSWPSGSILMPGE